MATATNLFMKMIYEKPKLSLKNIFKYWKHKREVKKFRNDILKGSPSFGLLWKTATFIKLAEIVFFYDNSTTNTEIGLFSSNNYSIGENGFKIIDEKCTITIKLISESQRVLLEVNRNFGGKFRSSMSFMDNKWEGDPEAYDEMLLEELIKIINKKIVMLFDWCYNKR